MALKSSPAIGGPTIETTSSSTLSEEDEGIGSGGAAGWELPEEFGVLRRLLESRMGKRGKREFVQVLRLMENFQPEEVHDAVRDAIRLGAVSFDAVKHLVLCRIEGRPPSLDMELYPYLPRTNVATTSTRDYMALLAWSRS